MTNKSNNDKNLISDTKMRLFKYLFFEIILFKSKNKTMNRE